MARSYRLGPTRRAVNWLVTAMARRGAGPNSTYLLTTKGSRSGLDRTTPVVPVETNEHRYLVSPYGTVGWVHNVRASGTVVLSRGRVSERLAATEVEANEAGPVLRRYLSQARVTAPYFDAKRDDPVGTFVAEADRHPVFRLGQLDAPGP